MNSETSTRYGSRVRRHGRSRAVRAYQASSFLVNACAFGGLAARGVDERVMPPQDTAHGRAMAAVGALDLVRYFGRWGRRPAQHVLGNAGRFTYLLIDMLRGLAEWRVYIPRTFEQATNIHLLLPRVIAGILVIPALTMFANATGIVVGYLTAKGSLGLTYADFEYGARYFFRPLDLWYSLIKSYCFAGAVTLIPCYIGYNAQQGAEGVGRATTTAVVSASVSILLLDALITKLLLGVK